MRTYCKLYNAETNSYSIIFRDIDDPDNTYYVYITASMVESIATEIVERMNHV